jgi:hypothetical protein
MHDQSIPGYPYPFDTRSVNLKLSSQLGAGDLGMDIRCDAVAEDVPSCCVPLGKGEPFLPREMAPDALGVRTHFIHDNRWIGVPFMQ